MSLRARSTLRPADDWLFCAGQPQRAIVWLRASIAGGGAKLAGAGCYWRTQFIGELRGTDSEVPALRLAPHDPRSWQTEGRT